MARVPTRREFVLMPAATLAAASPKKKVACVVTEYRYWSHADVIVGRLLGGYSANGVHSEPRTRVVSLYTHQVPQNDMSRDLAARHGFKIYPSIRETLYLGGPKLAVDAVCFVGEHGNYPTNDVGQKLYPRHELFMEICDAIEQSGRAVPVFFDKHLSYSWEKASEIYQRARKLKLPFMAGSSVSVTIRTPELEIPIDTPIHRAAVVGSGDLDAYGFHLLESAQCMLERRAGGETGVASVEWIEGDAVWRWRDGAGAWSKPLTDAAGQATTLPEQRGNRPPVMFLVNYTDGLQLAAFMLARGGNGRGFACQGTAGRVMATSFGPKKPDRPLPHFDGLLRCIDELFVTGKPVYPAERTLLTTGTLAFLFESRRRKLAVSTPELAITYRAPKSAWFQRS